MARLASIEKAGFFPTPPRVVEFIAQVVIPPTSSTKPCRLLDICAGEGDAASYLANAWQCDAYGVELDVNRAAVASQRLTTCLQGSYHQLKTTDGAFQVLFLNPPYDWGEKDAFSSRQEVHFLMDATPWLQHGGLLVFIPPRSVLKIPAFKDFMRQNFTSIHAWAFPEPEVQSFDQVVVFARRTSKHHYGSYGDLSVFDNPDQLQPLSEDCQYVADFFSYPSELAEFELVGFDPTEIAPSWDVENASWGYASSQWDVLVGEREGSSMRPLVAPRPGHLALLLAAGALDGAELRAGHLLKGGSEKIKIEIEDGDGVVERERIVSRLSVLDLETGDYETWQANEAPERTTEWFHKHGEDLARVIQTTYTPSFDGDLTPYVRALSKLTAPGILPGRAEPEFLYQQKEAAVAIAYWWGQGHKSVILSGEMGTGKTSMSIIAAMLSKHRRTIVMCPAHLVQKWIRECEVITGQKGIAVTARKLSEVDAFFAPNNEPSDDSILSLLDFCTRQKVQPRFLVLSKEMAKLGAKWEPAFKVQQAIIDKEIIDIQADPYYSYYNRPAPKKIVKTRLEVVVCPDCGEMQRLDGAYLTQEAFAKKVQRSCSACKGPLWQTTAISAKGTKRWPLARYINQRYKRQYGLILDECHQFSGASSDQSKAAQDLCSGALKILAMTGTLYGGRASSIFHLLYKVDPYFRQMYAYDECARFVAHHGLFEQRFEEEELTSVYGYRRGGKRSGGRIREIPGMSPAMIPVILPYTLFIKLKDLRLELPPYTEEVELLDHDPDIFKAASKLMGDVKSILRDFPGILGQYLMACLGYPDCPEQAEEIVATDRETGDVTVVASAPAFPSRILPKDKRVIEIVKEEKAADRQVLVYFSQTHRRDARMRIKAALEAEGLRVKVLDAGVSPEKREEWLQKAVETGFDVMLTNGRLVETGMDLFFAATIIQYGVEYSTSSLRQSLRRSWRLGQHKPIRVVFLMYRETMQATAINLIARKMRAAEMVDGDETGGLAQTDESGTNFFVELAYDVIQAAHDADIKGA